LAVAERAEVMQKALLDQIQYLVQSHLLAGEKVPLVTDRGLLVMGVLVVAEMVTEVITGVEAPG
jgi:hypothetical protein